MTIENLPTAKPKCWVLDADKLRDGYASAWSVHDTLKAAILTARVRRLWFDNNAVVLEEKIGGPDILHRCF